MIPPLSTTVPHPRLRRWTALIVLLLVSGTVAYAAWRVSEAFAFANQSTPFQSEPEQAEASLLVVGDSTATGAGASTAETSVPGLIGAAHPRLRIENRARVGARYREVLAQLDGTERFDYVLVMAGGNDVVRFTPRDELQEDIRRVAVRARELGRTVILMPPGNVANSPFYVAPVSWAVRPRARQLHSAAREAAKATGALYVNLYRHRSQDPFALQPERFNARDGLHPNDAGYRLWYGALQAQAQLDDRLTGALHQMARAH